MRERSLESQQRIKIRSINHCCSTYVSGHEFYRNPQVESGMGQIIFNKNYASYYLIFDVYRSITSLHFGLTAKKRKLSILSQLISTLCDDFCQKRNRTCANNRR